MNDQHPNDQHPNDQHPNDPSLDPAEDARIRSLLADLGSTHAPEATTMPPEVAARLDETLAGLVADRTSTSASTASNVVPLRRRWAQRGAAVAAAVIVLGVGGVAVANLGGSSGAEDQADSSAGGAAASDSRAEAEDSGTDGPAEPGEPKTGLLSPDVPQLSVASFDTQVARLVAAGQVPAPRAGLSERERTSTDRRELSSADKSDSRVNGTTTGGCPGPETGDGSRHTTVMYDGSPAALVVHPPRARKRLVEAWTCAGNKRLDSARIPVAMPASEDSSSQTSPGDPGLGSAPPTP